MIEQSELDALRDRVNMTAEEHLSAEEVKKLKDELKESNDKLIEAQAEIERLKALVNNK